jgi:hypothetical protein
MPDAIFSSWQLAVRRIVTRFAKARGSLNCRTLFYIKFEELTLYDCFDCCLMIDARFGMATRAAKPSHFFHYNVFNEFARLHKTVISH